MIEINVPQATYEKFKSDTINNKFISRHVVDLNEVGLKDVKTILVKDREIPITHKAFSALLDIIGMSRGFLDTVKSSMNDEKSGQKFMNLIIKQMKGRKAITLVLVYNDVMNCVTNIYKKESKLITDPQYFDILERMISKTPSAFLRNISRNAEGDINAVIKVPNLEFQFGNFSNEYFKSGFTLDLTAKGMGSSFFTERLVCTNGMVSTNKFSNQFVFDPGKVSNFITDVLDERYQAENIGGFKKQIARTMSCPASFKEVLFARNRVSNYSGQYAERFLRNLSADRIEATFNHASPEYLQNTDIHDALYTDITLWELINEVTSISSLIEQEDLVSGVGERLNFSLQKLGGELMFKKPDLTPVNIRQVFNPVQVAKQMNLLEIK